MSSKTKRFPYLFMTLLLVIAIFGTALPAVGQGFTPYSHLNYFVASQKMVRGGAAMLDPAVLPDFEFLYTLDMTPGSGQTFTLKSIEDTKFDDRLFIQRIVISGKFAQYLSSYAYRDTGGNWTTTNVTSNPTTINIGDATTAIDANARINGVRSITGIRFTFRDQGAAGKGFTIGPGATGTEGNIRVYFKVSNPTAVIAQNIDNIGGPNPPSPICLPDATKPVQPWAVCNHARFEGYSGNFSAFAYAAATGLLQKPIPTYSFSKGDNQSVVVNDIGTASFKVATGAMLSINQYRELTFTAILPPNYSFVSARATNPAVQAKVKSVTTSSVAGGRTKVVLVFNDFEHSLVSGTQTGAFNLTVSFVPSAAAANADVIGYFSMRNYDSITPGETEIQRRLRSGGAGGTVVATSIGNFVRDNYDLNGNGNTNEEILGDSVRINLIRPSSGVTGSTYFGASSGHDRLVNVAKGNTYIYRTELSAAGNQANGAKLYEAFPNSGEGIRAKLNGPITNPDATRYIIEYCTQANPSVDPVTGSTDGACSWQPSLTDWTTATAYRVRLRPGQSVPVNAAHQFAVTMKADGPAYMTSQHTVWVSGDGGATFVKTIGSPLTAAMKARVRITYRWTKPSESIPNPTTTVHVVGTPADKVIPSEVGNISMSPAAPNLAYGEVEKDFTGYGMDANVLKSISYVFSADAITNWDGPTPSGVCDVNTGAIKNAADSNYDYHCYFDYSYPSPTSVKLVGKKGWDPHVTIGRVGAFDMELQYRVAGSGNPFHPVPVTLLKPTLGSDNCLTENPVHPMGVLQEESFTWCVPAGPAQGGTDTYEFRLVEIALSEVAAKRWKAVDGTFESTLGPNGGYSAAFTQNGNAYEAKLTNMLNQVTYTPANPLTAKVRWYNGPDGKPEAYLTLKRTAISGAEACTLGDAEEVTGTGGNVIRMAINDVMGAGWTRTTVAGDTIWEKSFALSGFPEMNEYGCRFTYYIVETKADGTDLTPAGYNKTDGASGGGSALEIVNRYNVERIQIKGKKTWANGTALPRPTVTLGLYVKHEVGTVKHLTIPEHPSLNEVVPQPIYMDAATGCDPAAAYQAAGQVAVNSDTEVYWCVPKYQKDGVTEIDYYVDENLGADFTDASPMAGAPAGPSGLNTGAAAPTNYVKTYTDGKTEITNTYVPPTINPDPMTGNGSVTAEVKWLPTGVTVPANTPVTLKLKRQWRLAEDVDCSVAGNCGTEEVVSTVSSAITDVTLNSDDAGTHQWKHTWTDDKTNPNDNLPATNADGVRYFYYVERVAGPTNFELVPLAAGVNPGLILTYQYRTPMTDVTAKKIWNGGTDPRPQVRFTLQRSADGGTNWENVPSRDLDNCGGACPTTQPYRFSTSTGQTEVEVHWRTKKDAPDGTAYQFKVIEQAVPGYVIDTAGTSELQITNKYVPPMGDVEATKVWVGGQNAGPRPNVVLRLMRTEGMAVPDPACTGFTEAVPPAELDGAAGYSTSNPVTLPNGTTTVKWKTNLFSIANGTKYTFCLKEETLTDYPNPTITADGTGRNFTVTNTYQSPRIDFVGTKVWSGGTEATKPASIQLTLKRKVGASYVAVDPSEIVAPDASYTGDNPATVTPDAGGNWTVKWSVLKTDANGDDYEYRVEEGVFPAGWMGTISPDGKTVTNTFIVQNNQTVTGEKKWIGGTYADVHLVLYRVILNADGTDRPGTKEQVPAVGGIVNPVPLTLANAAAHHWKYTWMGLQDKDQATGLSYRYFIDESAVPAGYTKVKSQSDPTPITDNDTLTVTNLAAPQPGTVTGVKVWQGGRDNNRISVSLKLMRKRNGGVTWEQVPGVANPVTLNADNVTGHPAHNWQYTWMGLDTTTFEYAVEEVGFAPGASYEEIPDVNPYSVTNKYRVPPYDDPNTPQDENGKVIGKVVWNNGGAAIDSASVTLQLYRAKVEAGGCDYSNKTAVQAPVTLNGADAATHHWMHEWSGLLGEEETTGKKFCYFIDDVAPPAGFQQIDETAIPPQPVITENKDLQVTYELIQAAGSFTGKKVWIGSVGSYCDVELKLMVHIAGGANSLVTTDADNNSLLDNPVTLAAGNAGTHHWEHTWNNLKDPAAYAPGSYYFVDEGPLPAGCPFVKQALSGLSPNTVTNEYRIPTIEINVTKEWVNGQLKRKPVVITLEQSNDGNTWSTAPLETGAGCAVNNPYTTSQPPSTASSPNTVSETVKFCVKSANAAGPLQFQVTEAYSIPGDPNNALWPIPANRSNITGTVATGFTIRNTFVPAKSNITVTKIWSGGIGANPVTIYLDQSIGSNPPNPIPVTLSDADKVGGNPMIWAKDVSNLPVTDEKGIDYTYEVREDALGGCIAPVYNQAQFTVTNTCNPQQRNLKVIVEWHGGPLPRPNVNVRVVGVAGTNPSTTNDFTINGAPSWEHTESLPQNHSDGTLFDYTVSVLNAATDLSIYDITFDPTTPVQLTADSEVRIKLTYRQPTASVTATKTWVGGGTLTRPDVYFVLYSKKQGTIDSFAPVASAPVMTLPHGTTTVTWNSVASKDIDGNQLEFAVHETDSTGTDLAFVPANYTKVENGLNVINTYQSSGTITANKVWGAGTSPHPTIWFKLYRQLGSSPVEEVPGAAIFELPDGTVQADWSGVELTDSTGVPYVFTVKEVDATGADWVAPGYVKIERDLTVTNTKKGILTVGVETDPATSESFEIAVSNVNGDSHTERIDNNPTDPTYPDTMIVTDIPAVEHTVRINGLDLEAWEVLAIDCTSQPLDGSTPPAPLTIDPEFNFSGKMTGVFKIPNVPDQAQLACGYKLRSLVGGKITVHNQTLPNPAQPVYPTYQYLVSGAGYLDFNMLANDTIPNAQEVAPGTYQIKQLNIDGWVTIDVVVKSSIEGRRPMVSLNEERVATPPTPLGSETFTGWQSVLTFTVQPKEQVTVTFINAPKNTVMIRKETIPSGVPNKFNFAGKLSGTIGDGEYLIQANMTPEGTQWQITEQGVEFWELVEVNCIERGEIGNTPTHGDTGTASAYVGLDEGESIICTFVNRRYGETVEHYDPPVPGFTDWADALPRTGFTPGRVTVLPEQSAAKLYLDSTLTLNIPGLNQTLEIVGIPKQDGTWDVSYLGQKAGYLEGSAYPTWDGNSIVTAHVWDAYNNPGPFFGLKNLRYGDRFTITAYGKTYTYEVRESEQLLETDVDQMMVSKEGSWVTLMTCEAYDEGEQKYKYRRLVRGVLIDVE